MDTNLNAPENDSEKKINSNRIFEIPEEGMLGLLALGDIGLKMWREKRAQIQKEQATGNEKNTDHS